MKTYITVSVNKEQIRIHRGMTVKHALIACNQVLYEAAMKGEISLEDASGFQIGLDGGLEDGAEIVARFRSR
jgi:hypothetical protein